MKKRVISVLLILATMTGFVLVFRQLGSAPASSSDSWDVQLTATMDAYSDVSEFGERSDAAEGFDLAYDLLDPPAPPVGVVSYFWHPDNPTSPVDMRKLSSSMIPPSSFMTWTYIVESVGIGGTMHISWSASEIATIPPEYAVHLRDSAGITTIADMRVVTEHSFAVEAGTTYTFIIAVSVEVEVEVGWIEGTVTDTDTGQPLEGATVSADTYSGLTDSSGFYSIELSPGTYDVTAEMTGYEPKTGMGVSVSAGETVIQDFALSPIVVVGWMEGTVTDEDTLLPIEGATVSADGYSDTTEALGFYSIEVSPGTYSVTAEMTGYISETVPGVEVIADQTVTVDFALSPVTPATIESCDSTGTNKDIFDPSETVYVKGSGYSESTTYDMYIVNDVTAWSDGMAIPGCVPGTATTVTSDPTGDIPPTVVWSPSLTPGKYDIVVDFNGNGMYDAEIDALDDNDIEVTAGFFVIPEYAFGTILGLVACFAAFGVFLRSKRMK